MRSPRWRWYGRIAGAAALSSIVLWPASRGALAVFGDAAAVDTNNFTTAAHFGRVASGTYPGNGVDNRPITGVGFRPDVVIVKSVGGNLAVERTSSMAGDASKPLTGATALSANRVQSLDADGFTIGTHATVNTSGTTYYWVAFQSCCARLRVGSYLGNGSAQALTGFGFSPEYVVVMSAGGNAPIQRSSTMSTSFRFDTTAAAANGITSLDADGFSVGNSAQVNGNGTTYHYVAWDEEAGYMHVGSYTGDGADNRSITGAGFQPEYVVVKSETASTATVHRPVALLGDATLHFTATANLTNAIQALEADGFQIGTAAQTNTSATTYHWVAFHDP